MFLSESRERGCEMSLEENSKGQFPHKKVEYGIVPLLFALAFLFYFSIF